MNEKLRFRLRIAAQVLFCVFTVWSVGSMFLFTGSGNMRVNRSVIFRYFTVDSNILCAVSCVFSLLQACLKRASWGKAAMLLRYAGAAAVAVTLTTVLVFLGPLYGYPAMFANWNLWLHLLGPVLAILSFVFLERDGTNPEKNHLLLSLLPVIVYGAVYFVMVVLLGEGKGGWPDFYGFNRGGAWYLSFAAMLAGSALVSMALLKLRSGRKNKG